MSSFANYRDANLIFRVDTLHVDIPPGGSQDFQLWFGSPIENSLAFPDGAAIQVAVADAGGGGMSTGDVKLALTQGGLAGATPGAALNLGIEILSEVANAVSYWVRLTDTAGAGLYFDLSLTMNFKEARVVL